MEDTPKHGPLDRINQGLTAIALVGFIGMLVSTWSQVLFRKLAISLDWTEELARVLFLTSVFLGIAIALRERKHIIVDFIFNRLPPRVRAGVRIFFDILILMFLASLFRGAAKMTAVTWESYMIAMDWLRTGHIYLIECIAIGFMILFLLADIWTNVRRLARSTPQSEGGPE